LPLASAGLLVLTKKAGCVLQASPPVLCLQAGDCSGEVLAGIFNQTKVYPHERDPLHHPYDFLFCRIFSILHPHRISAPEGCAGLRLDYQEGKEAIIQSLPPVLLSAIKNLSALPPQTCRCCLWIHEGGIRIHLIQPESQDLNKKEGLDWSLAALDILHQNALFPCQWRWQKGQWVHLDKCRAETLSGFAPMHVGDLLSKRMLTARDFS